MEIKLRTVGEVTVLDLKGKVTLGDGDSALKNVIDSLLKEGKKRILLNLADVPYLDSSGLGEIVRAYTTVSRQGGQLKLVSPNPRIGSLVEQTKLLTVFESYDSELKALDSFNTITGAALVQQGAAAEPAFVSLSSLDQVRVADIGIVTILVAGVGLLLAGIVLWPGTHFGAGLVFGGGIVGYEALHLLLKGRR